ncbi:GNAT family N-acetyltransferase [Coxiella burnetii]|uniref:Ribosomal-protein-alanine acetyltransferase n=2 Tax=Coxiella burnetii TaxID=777 RepID=Q83E29_COXBU|nr:GNAT family N-acetyltransferase [Coxiella burnetii]NP_819539.1 ribosomal-protein-alanine acetyltransferase [Coxiella burnetii RSA 493]AAO90053.1 ribosomal-protein-alanine acetyltransferase [Coxiella burnetii RSA 493]ABS76789.1 ribosomal-protein-alanine acetyltransferase [Coxiella burnetii Dugway 5J108-111]ABX77911.1 acetyltransferase, GNAT family [Coxiella burnetii RSA 331]ACJ18802.1 ribosomal-protein-alanine acetyltransferase [Coxiella burnetii CbuG_Q212]AIT63597.1 Ribosomal-protein-alani
MLNAFYSSKFPILNVDDTFFLREQMIKDVEAFFEYYADPDVAHYILASNPRNLAEAAAEITYCHDLFKYRRGIYWTLARKEDDRMIGAIGLYINNQHYRAEICYDLSKHYWNQGIMTKALQVVVDFCFSRIALNRIEAVTLKENAASIAMLKKAGFAHEGSLKNYRYYKGRSHDIEMFAITPEMSSNQKLEKTWARHENFLNLDL